jgi:hypothetical protein
MFIYPPNIDSITSILTLSKAIKARLTKQYAVQGHIPLFYQRVLVQCLSIHVWCYKPEDQSLSNKSTKLKKMRISCKSFHC